MAGMESLCSRCNVWCQCRRWILRWGWLLGRVERRGTNSLSSRGRWQWTNDEVVEGRGKSRDETGDGWDTVGGRAFFALLDGQGADGRVMLLHLGAYCVCGRWSKGESRLRLAQPEREPESAARVREQGFCGREE
ncbi:hypothetical protein KVT40_000216 [Elsinoe batatas]|uniref:Uncharacterized protein n=1 Tax=Elsinoe batatas TaxID=2601811 RepID=A0A8K0L6Y6_9PEZI|nr:hypothetical protein KVT40_000216 [Elsinoe batatas]